MEDLDAKKGYLDILLQQYSECWQSIRNDSNSVWQIPALLLTTISVLGIAFAQLYGIPIARVLTLSVGFGFSLVSLLALIKHRLSCNVKTVDFDNIQKQLMTLLKQEEFQSLFNKSNKDVKEDEKLQFREIHFKADLIAKDLEKTEKETEKKTLIARIRYWLYRRSAYKWQLCLTVAIVLGIAILLVYELCLL